MSYDLAVWEGERPYDDATGAEALAAVYDQLQRDLDDGTEPSDAISAYVAALVTRWPDITEDDGESSPWADGPLIANAAGPAIYFGLVMSRAADASYAAGLAARHGLVAYDPQLERFVP